MSFWEKIEDIGRGARDSIFGEKPDAPAPSSQEETLGQISLAQAARYKKRYAGLQGDLAAYAERDMTPLMRGRTNATMMQGLGQTGPMSLAGRMAYQDAGSSGLGTALTTAGRQERSRRTGILGNAVKFGTGNATTAIQGLGDASSAAATTGAAQYRSRMETLNRKFGRAGQAFGTAVGMGMMVAGMPQTPSGSPAPAANLNQDFDFTSPQYNYGGRNLNQNFDV